MGEIFMSMFGSTRVRVIFLICANLFIVQIAKAQPSLAGFLSIDCGSDSSYVDPVTTIQWQSDSNFISTGYDVQVQAPPSNNLTNLFSEFKTLRFFNDTRMTKYCYTLPVTDNSTYSLRATFFYGTSDVAGPDPPSFQLALDDTIVANISTSRSNAYYFEYIYLSRGNVTFLCLLRDETQAVPFISAISLRPAVMHERFDGYLADNKYIQTNRRLNFGGTVRVRFPNDVHDRYWTPVGTNSSFLLNNTTPVRMLSTTHNIDLTDYGTLVPEAVLQTAVTTQGNLTIQGLTFDSAPVHLILHFAELDNHTSGISRKFMVHVPSATKEAYVNPFNYSLQAYKPMFWYFGRMSFTSSDDELVFYPKPRSRLGPLLNALELYSFVDVTSYTTSSQEATAIEAIKKSMNLTEWAGDPCLPVPHSWLSCTVPGATLQKRVDQLSLTGYHLQGTIPASTFALLDVTSLSLDNNALTGTFPNLSSMTTLNQLHLHNNLLSGPLPDWLATMRDLQELSIQNNNFSGVIPAQLLTRNSMNFTYRPGNPLLIEQSSTPNTTVGSTGAKPVVHAAAYILVTVIVLETLYMLK